LLRMSVEQTSDSRTGTACVCILERAAWDGPLTQLPQWKRDRLWPRSGPDGTVTRRGALRCSLCRRPSTSAGIFLLLRHPGPRGAVCSPSSALVSLLSAFPTYTFAGALLAATYHWADGAQARRGALNAALPVYRCDCAQDGTHGSPQKTRLRFAVCGDISPCLTVALNCLRQNKRRYAGRFLFACCLTNHHAPHALGLLTAVARSGALVHLPRHRAAHHRTCVPYTFAYGS